MTKGDNFTILYVEDDLPTQSLMSDILEEYFSTVLLANNGEEALTIYQNNHIDIILTDINMPKLNGLQLLQKIRAENSEIPVLITTAHNDFNYLVEFIKLKANGFVIKPIDLFQFEEELLSKIKELKQKQLLISQAKLLEEEILGETTNKSKSFEKKTD